MIEDQLGLEHNFIPFKIFYDAVHIGSISFGLSILLKQAVGNMVLFIPLGFAFPLFFSNMKIKKCLFIGFSVSLAIEVFQALAGLWVGYNYRAADMDDLMFNTLGTAIGLLIWRRLNSFLINKKRIDFKREKYMIVPKGKKAHI